MVMDGKGKMQVEDDAMLTKKYVGPVNCASCEKGIVNLQGMPAEYLAWKRLPFREPQERIARVSFIWLTRDSTGKASRRSSTWWSPVTRCARTVALSSIWTQPRRMTSEITAPPKICMNSSPWRWVHRLDGSATWSKTATLSHQRRQTQTGMFRRICKPTTPTSKSDLKLRARREATKLCRPRWQTYPA